MRQRGKIPHILSVIQSVSKSTSITCPTHVLLIDDDVNNIQTAMACKFHAFWMNAEDSNAVWNQMLALFSSI